MRACHPAATVLVLLAPLLAAASACKKSEASTPLADVVASEHGFTPASLKLPGGGPGWSGNGNLVLNELTLHAAPAERPDQARAIPAKYRP